MLFSLTTLHQTYWSLLEKVPPKKLKLRKYESEQPLASYRFRSHPRTLRVRIDDEVFEHTMKEFPELSTDSHEKLRKIDEE